MTRKYQVVTLPPAEADMEAAFQWIYAKAPDKAVEWFENVREAISSLTAFPDRCPLAPECANFKLPIRQLVYGKRSGKYRILFIVGLGKVHVLHVRHGARLILDAES